MKRTIACLLASLLATALAACGTQPPLSDTQQLAIACRAADGGLAIATDVFTGGALNTVQSDITPAIDGVCPAVATAPIQQ
ncbi:hypothetical protein AAGS40_23135 [Paraburkholderia sp. PREW-6R]|uniref:hypothetical protein n=1 Tax=Paraburkholderia sp. PREW-6R TaxID=3141544 RepID=UPI0031F4D6C2